MFLELLSVVMLRPSREELRLAVSLLNSEHSQSFSLVFYQCLHEERQLTLSNNSSALSLEVLFPL